MRLPISLILSGALLSGCATVIEGTTQVVDVRTYPPGAACTLLRSGEVIAVVDPTPQKVTLSRGLRNIELKCTKEGHDDGRGVLKSDMTEAAIGNILVGGIIGGLVDASTGALGTYRKGVRVSLRERKELAKAVKTLPEKLAEKQPVEEDTKVADARETAEPASDAPAVIRPKIQPALAMTRDLTLTIKRNPGLDRFLKQLEETGWGEFAAPGLAD